MPVRQTYQFNAPAGTVSGGGLILANHADVKGAKTDEISRPFVLDIPTNNILTLGDRVAGGRSGLSLPVMPDGGWGLRQRSVSVGTHAVTVDDCVILASQTAGVVTLNLPAANLFPGQQLTFLRVGVGGNAIIINAAVGDNIAGAAVTEMHEARESLELLSDGVNTWNVVTMRAHTYPLANNDLFNGVAATTMQTMATSPVYWFTGRPVCVFFGLSMRDVYASPEFMQVNFFVRVDAGPDIKLGQWVTNQNNVRLAASGSNIITPSRGLHTLDLRWQMSLGALGAGTMDSDDHIAFNCVVT